MGLSPPVLTEFRASNTEAWHAVSWSHDFTTILITGWGKIFEVKV